MARFCALAGVSLGMLSMTAGAGPLWRAYRVRQNSSQAGEFNPFEVKRAARSAKQRLAALRAPQVKPQDKSQVKPVVSRPARPGPARPEPVRAVLRPLTAQVIPASPVVAPSAGTAVPEQPVATPVVSTPVDAVAEPPAPMVEAPVAAPPPVALGPALLPPPVAAPAPLPPFRVPYRPPLRSPFRP